MTAKLLISMVIAGLIILSLWDYERRAAMTDEERRRDDEETRSTW